MIKILKNVIIGEAIALVLSGGKLMRTSIKNLTNEIRKKN